MSTSTATKEQLRSRILSQKPRVKLVVLEDEVNGKMEVEVRQITVGKLLDSLKEEDTKKRMANLIAMSCFVPSTGEQLFEDTDAEALMEMPSGGYYQQIIEAVNANVALDKQQAEAKKSSGTTPSS